MDGKWHVNEVTFLLADYTPVEMTPFEDGITSGDLAASAGILADELKREAMAIPFYLLPSGERDTPVVHTRSFLTAGRTSGGVRMRVTAEITFQDPSREKLNDFLLTYPKEIRLVSVSIRLTPETTADPGFCASDLYEKMRGQHVIVGYDDRKGVTVKGEDEVYLSLLCGDDKSLTVTLEAEDDFWFGRAVEGFSVPALLEDLFEEGVEKS